MSLAIHLRPAVKEDMERVHQLITELAVYEKEPDAVTNTIEGLKEDGFGPNKVFDAIVAEVNDEVVGFALYYTKYSTWKGSCLYLEDFIVTADMRGQGIGKKLFDKVYSIAKEKGAKRFEWQVLDWNEPAINFYKKYDVVFEDDWRNAKIFL